MISWLVVALLRQTDPRNEAEMFGESPVELAADAGAPAPVSSTRERDDVLFDTGATFFEDGGTDERDARMLGAVGKNRFETGEEKTDPLKIGGTNVGDATATVSPDGGGWLWLAKSFAAIGCPPDERGWISILGKLNGGSGS